MRSLNKLFRIVVIAGLVFTGVFGSPGRSCIVYAGTGGSAASSGTAASAEAPAPDCTYTVSGNKKVCGHYDDDLSDEIISFINSFRKQKGLRTLAVSDAMMVFTRSSVLKSAYNYRSYSTINSVKGFRTASVTAKGPGSAQALFSMMMRSRKTASKLLDGSFRYIGASVFASTVPTGRIFGGQPEMVYRYYVVVSAGR